MKTVSVVFFAIVILASVGLIMWRLLLPMKDSAHKKIMLAVAIVGLIVCELLLFLSARVPSKVDAVLSAGIESVEGHLEATNPGYINKVLSTKELEEALTDAKMLNTYIDETPNAGLAVRLLGAGAYLGYIKTFSESIEDNLKDMREAGTPITLHNVFLRAQDMSRPPVLKAAKVFEILVIILSVLFILALLLAYYILKKNESDLNDPRIIMVEQPDSIERGNQTKGE